MANEEKEFHPFIDAMNNAINDLGSGKIYIVIDTISKDKTLELCNELSKKDPKYITVWAPENKNVVDAYIKGLHVAYEAGHELIVEMDAGLSHDPKAISTFLKTLSEGNECALGSRFIDGGSMGDSPFRRRFLSKTGTLLANILLGTKLHDMTSGFQGFHRNVVEKIIQYPFKSTAHFYQIELRYLLRKRKIVELPIHYKAPSPRVSKGAIKNAISTFFYYSFQRLIGNRPTI